MVYHRILDIVLCTVQLDFALFCLIFIGVELTYIITGFPDSSVGKESACNSGDLVQFLGWEDPLEKG